MFVTERHFMIPESPKEVALLQGSKQLKKNVLEYKKYQFSFWTEDLEDDMLLNEFLRKLDHKFSFESVVLDDELDSKSLVKRLVEEISPEIVIDIRKDENLGYNIEPVKIKLDERGIKYRWIPLLGQKGHMREGLFDVNQLLKSYRRICFVGTSDRRLARICRMLKKSNRIEFQE